MTLPRGQASPVPPKPAKVRVFHCRSGLLAKGDMSSKTSLLISHPDHQATAELSGITGFTTGGSDTDNLAQISTDFPVCERNEGFKPHSLSPELTTILSKFDTVSFKKRSFYI